MMNKMFKIAAFCVAPLFIASSSTETIAAGQCYKGTMSSSGGGTRWTGQLEICVNASSGYLSVSGSRCDGRLDFAGAFSDDKLKVISLKQCPNGPNGTYNLTRSKNGKKVTGSFSGFSGGYGGSLSVKRVGN